MANWPITAPAQSKLGYQNCVNDLPPRPSTFDITPLMGMCQDQICDGFTIGELATNSTVAITRVCREMSSVIERPFDTVEVCPRLTSCSLWPCTAQP